MKKKEERARDEKKTPKGEPEMHGGSGYRIGAEPGEREVALAARDVDEQRERARRSGEIGQYIDDGVSAQPKAGLPGGFDPVSGRMHPALAQVPTDDTITADLAASSMSVVGDPNMEIAEQPDARDALPTESAAVNPVAVDRTKLDEYAHQKGKRLEDIVPRMPPPVQASEKATKAPAREGSEAKAPKVGPK